MENDIKNREATQFRTGTEQVAIARAGGIASGEARRRKRTMRELAEAIAEKRIKVTMPDKSTEEMTYDAAVIFRQYQKAITEGDTTAAKFLAELMGELKTNVNVATEGMTVVVKADTAKNLAKIVTNENRCGDE